MKGKLIILAVLGCATHLTAIMLPDAMRLRNYSEDAILMVKTATGLVNFGTWVLIGNLFAQATIKK